MNTELPHVVQHAMLPPIIDVDPLVTALIVTDLQTAFVEPGGSLAIPGISLIISNVNHLIRRFRSAGATIILTRHTLTSEGAYALPRWIATLGWGDEASALLRLGARDHEISSAIETDEADVLINKYRASAFHPQSSDINTILSARNIDTTVIVGCMTNVCCEGTARDSHMFGYRTIVVSDAMAARTSAEHDASILNVGAAFADIKTTAEMLRLLD